MKKIIFVMCTLLTVLAFTGCNEKTGSSSAKTSVPKKTVCSVVLEDGWALYEANAEDGKLRAAAEVSKGDIINVADKGTGKYETVPMTRVLSNKTEDAINVVSVVYENKPYYARAIYISDYGAAEPAVVLTETQEYSKPDILGITNKKLSAGTIVAVYADSTSDFCHARIYNGSDYGREIYIPADCVGRGVSTVELVKTLSSFNKDTKVEVVDAVLETIYEKWAAEHRLNAKTYDYLLNVLNSDNRNFEVSDELVYRFGEMYYAIFGE